MSITKNMVNYRETTDRRGIAYNSKYKSYDNTKKQIGDREEDLLYTLCEEGNLSDLESFVFEYDIRASPPMRSPFIELALFTASAKNQKNIVSFLIEKGAKNYTIALYNACKYGHVELSKYLISLGAKAEDDTLRQPCIYGYEDMVSLLLYHGARDRSGFGMLNACLYGHKKIAELLIDSGETPLDGTGIEWASKGGHLNLVKFLISTGDSLEKRGISALIGACENGHFEIVKYLCENGLVIQKDETKSPFLYRETAAVYWAATRGHKKIVKYLVEKGASIWAQDIIESVSGRGYLEIVNFLIKSGRTGYDIEKCVQNAAQNGHIDIIRYFLNFGEYSLSRDEKVLLSAIIGRQKETIQFLVEHGAILPQRVNKREMFYIKEQKKMYTYLRKYTNVDKMECT